jgi:hypothetical protein
MTMTVFANKDAFFELGVETIQPSTSHASQDCSICAHPLAMHHIDASPKSKLRGYHDAVRIIACGHAHGSDCLAAWLDVGNACPKCNRILFELTGDPITQGDISTIVHMLGPLYGEARVNVALVGMMQKKQKEQKALERVHGQEVARQKMEDRKEFDERFALKDDDFLDSDDEEMKFEEQDDMEEDGNEGGDIEEKGAEEMMDDQEQERAHAKEHEGTHEEPF